MPFLLCICVHNQPSCCLHLIRSVPQLQHQISETITTILKFIETFVTHFTVEQHNLWISTGIGQPYFQTSHLQNNLQIMEAVIGFVMKYCGEHMEAYAQCVTDNPKDWQTKCVELKNKATDCSNNHPAVRQISHECSNEFAAYDKCLKINAEDVNICVDVLHSFMNCAQKSALRIENAYTTQDEQTKST